ncbi:MAG: single-stranded-DNA-specific exonuclease RecJ [Lachnospiraceae bacterium]|nr:single-stranded-DNA-specific exonuclease RecJ [Lachnospiraceae bacterium]
MKKEWILLRKQADYAMLSRKLGIDPVAVRVMVNRGLTGLDEMREFLSDDISESFSYKGLPDLKAAVNKLKDVRDRKLKCRIVGDYDADGVCSVTILMKGLKLFGIDCDFVIPNRLIDGYGINESIVENAKKDKIGCIITCDNGISARDAIDLAIDYGMEVIVTDHHTVTASEVPTKADILVNPKRDNNTYPFRDICGAAVAFKVLCALFEGDPAFDSIKDELLEFVAIATVTDVMPLTDENRNAVKWVLKKLRKSSNPGLRKLCEKCEISKKAALSCYDIGFRIGPCINAAGRIDVADSCVRLFLSDDEAKNSKICDRLLELNDERKALTDLCVKDGTEEVTKKYVDRIPDVCVLYLPKCHVAICGLVAGRIRENFYRPTLVFTDANGMLTGSGRSIDEYNMIEHIQECSDLLEKFGGHKAACGLSLKKENLEELIKRLNENTGLSDEDLTEKLRIDADMPLSYVSFGLISDLARLEPFGAGNVTPVFAQKDLHLVSMRRFGADRTHMVITIKDPKGSSKKLKLWRKADDFEEFLNSETGEDLSEIFNSPDKLFAKNIKLTISYYPELNTFRNETEIQFIVKDYKLS